MKFVRRWKPWPSSFSLAAIHKISNLRIRDEHLTSLLCWHFLPEHLSDSLAGPPTLSITSTNCVFVWNRSSDHVIDTATENSVTLANYESRVNNWRHTVIYITLRNHVTFKPLSTFRQHPHPTFIPSHHINGPLLTRESASYWFMLLWAWACVHNTANKITRSNLFYLTYAFKFTSLFKQTVFCLKYFLLQLKMSA